MDVYYWISLALLSLLLLLGYDEILVFAAKGLLFPLGDEVAVLRDDPGSLLVVGLVRVLVDLVKGLRDDGDQQVKHHDVGK